jgi:hypothetical protein
MIAWHEDLAGLPPPNSERAAAVPPWSVYMYRRDEIFKCRGIYDTFDV